ncbi:hypothetical protein HJFPF1_02105 [Paramyrothecium foliicola]|nr:hypothetical protein HJFPF1_02105 [Paramyrothecium foliicola]
MQSPLFRLILSSGLCAALLVGKFESEKCVDPSGMEECHELIDNDWLVCTDGECEGATNDAQRYRCHPLCGLALVQDRINCAATHCWDQVYSCEYQQTVYELLNWARGIPFDVVPFFPTPEDAPNSCDCNFAAIITSLARTDTESPRAFDAILETLESDQEREELEEASGCCQRSAYLSASMLPEAYRKHQWPRCGELMEKFPCDADGTGLTPPGGREGARFLKPDEFSSFTGTLVPTNKPGTVTAPVSGPTFTWTQRNRTMAITVANAEAKPTGEPAAGSEDDGEEGSGTEGEPTAEIGQADDNGNEGSGASRPLGSLPLLNILFAGAYAGALIQYRGAIAMSGSPLCTAAQKQHQGLDTRFTVWTLAAVACLTGSADAFLYRYYNSGSCDHNVSPDTTDPRIDQGPLLGSEGNCYSSPVGTNWQRLEIDNNWSGTNSHVITFCKVGCQGGGSALQPGTNCYTNVPGCAIGSFKVT